MMAKFEVACWGAFPMLLLAYVNDPCDGLESFLIMRQIKNDDHCINLLGNINKNQS